MKKELKNDWEKGALMLRLGYMFWQAQGYEPIAKAMESEGLVLLRNPPNGNQEFTDSCESLWMLCRAIRKLQKEGKTDIYGFCNNPDYYQQLLVDESKKLENFLKGFEGNYSPLIVQERVILHSVLGLLRHSRPVGLL